MLKFLKSALFMFLVVLAILALLAIVRVVHAATLPAFTITWSAPTQYTDGTTIAGPITYQVYAGASGQEVKLGNPVTASPYVINPTPAPGTTLCVQVTATVAGIESDRPTEVCGTVPRQPKGPATTTITIK